MNYLALAGLITFISVIICTILVLIKNVQKFLVWEIGTLGLGLWAFGIFKCFTTTDYTTALFWGRFLNTVAILIPPFLFNFCCLFANKKDEKKKELILYYLIGILYFFISIIFYKDFVKDVLPILSFKFYPYPGKLYYFFPVYYTYLLAYGVTLLVKELLNTNSHAKKNRIIYFLIGIALSVGGGCTTFFPVIGHQFAIFEKPPFGVILTPFYAYIVAYAILNNKILDINIAWRNILEYIFYASVSSYALARLYYFLLKFQIKDLFLILVCILPAVIIIPFFRESFKKFARKILLQKYNKIWNKLAKIAEDKTIRYEIRDIIQIIIKDVPEILAVENAVYYKLRDNGEKFESFEINGENPKFLSNNNVLIERFETNRELIYKEYLTDSEKDAKLKIFLKEQNIDVCFPVFFNRALVGIICYGPKKDGTIFHNEEIESITEIVKNAQEQIVNILYLKYMSSNYAEQVLNTYKNTEQMELLNAIKYLGSLRNLSELSQQIIGLINRYLNSISTHIYLYDEEKQGYLISENPTKNDNSLPMLIKESHYLMKYLKQRKEIVFCNELCKWAYESKSQDWTAAAELSKQLQATLIIPLIDVTLLGFIVVGDRRLKDEVYDSTDLMMLSFIADKAEISISNIFVREQATRDELTGCHNRSYLNNRTRIEVATALKHGKCLSYILGDADDFKWFNDNHGYDAGNEVLKAIANAIQKNLRSVDEFCRWGGEEFVMLAIGANQVEALVIAKKMLNSIHNDEKIKELEKLYERKISISIGTSCFESGEYRDEFTNENIRRISEALFKRAGKALKQAKKNGKDQIYESMSFTMGEEDEDKNMFSTKIIIATKNVEYTKLQIDKVEIETIPIF